MSESIDKNLILNQIKSHYKIEKDAELAHLLGIKPNTLANWRARNTIDYDIVVTKCEEIDANWLISGRGEMIKEENTALNFQESRAIYHRTTGIPLVRTEALGGLGSASFSIESKDILSRYVVPDFENIDFMLRVRGSSMAPKYNSGDVVACRILKERAFIQWNMPHVIATEEQGILIKRLKKGATPEVISAVSDNKDYDPFEVPWAEVKGIALVVGVIRLE